MAFMLAIAVFASVCLAEAGDTAPGNGCAAMIAGLRSEVAAENIADYDFTEQAMAYLEYVGTKLPDRDSTEVNSDHDAARAWILSELRSAGYADDQIEEQAFTVEDSGGVNVILTVEGEDPSHQIIAGGHYDGDGVGDNGSGIALLLATAVGLAGQKPHYTVKYIFFDCEEVGFIGSGYHAKSMTPAEAANTIYMINLDALAFGDYCNIYGGDIYLYCSAQEDPEPVLTEGYEFATNLSEALGFKVMRTEDLDGYYAEHGTGPEIEEGTLYTNPWTYSNPSPSNFVVPSPMTILASDHIEYLQRGIAYIYFEATNWFAECENDEVEKESYTGYVETFDYSLGKHGEFMNTEYDTWENLNRYFPGRAEQHYRIYSPLLSALILVR